MVSEGRPGSGLGSLSLLAFIGLEPKFAQAASGIEQSYCPLEDGGGGHDPAFQSHTLHGNAALSLRQLQRGKHVACIWQGPQTVQEVSAVVVGRRPDAGMLLAPPDVAICTPSELGAVRCQHLKSSARLCVLGE